MKPRPSLRTGVSAESSGLLLSIFLSEIGWMGILGREMTVFSIVIGHSSAVAVRKATQSISDGESVGVVAVQEVDWLPELRHDLQEYSDGKRVEFGSVKLKLPIHTTFRDKVLAATRALRYGETTTYGELARRVGHPGAARAVGTVMSTNRFPILIPCHRVLASGGKLGGYTSPSGTTLKQRLLDMERVG